MARMTNAQLKNENELLKAKLAVHEAKPTIPSLPLCRALLNAPAALQRKAYLERTGRTWASNLDVEMWLEELREAVGRA